MAFPLRFHSKAFEEYIEAYIWYETIQKGLGERFMQSVEKRLHQISEHPEFYGKKRSSHYREVKVQNFRI